MWRESPEVSSRSSQVNKAGGRLEMEATVQWPPLEDTPATAFAVAVRRRRRTQNAHRKRAEETGWYAPESRETGRTRAGRGKEDGRR